ncbi:MAG: hypothetical protein PF505_04240 [Vallitaleaceae bacterium]|jgi:hypothetical protein|nr:hypothetical protein [Vallitaleaceae bacterium]
MKNRNGLINIGNIDVINRVRNLVPGSLVYKGVKKELFSIEVISYNQDNFILKEFMTVKDFGAFYDQLDRTDYANIWINVTGLNAIEEVDHLGVYFDIPKLILEQVVNITKHSMFKVGPKYIFNDLQMIYLLDASVEVENITIYKTEL